MNTDILEAVIPLSIFHTWFTLNTFWEGKFTLSDFTHVNMKICDRRNVREHIEIQNGEKYITLDILLKFGSMYRMKITSLDPKHYLGRSVKGLINSLGINTIVRSKKSQVMSLLMAVWRIIQRLSRSLRFFLIRVMCGRVPNMNPLTVNFICHDSLHSVWWKLMLSIHTLTL